MEEFRNIVEMFVSGDYFLVFLAIMIIVLIVLVIALIKTKYDYSREVEYYKNNDKDDIIEGIEVPVEEKPEEVKESAPMIESKKETYFDYDSLEYSEKDEEESAVISTDELEKKTKERMETLGLTDSQAMIEKYEEEQEKKAIISYEQLLKNASNIEVTYKEEEREKGAPRINKVEVKTVELKDLENYSEEEEFLRMLKEFRVQLE